VRGRLAFTRFERGAKGGGEVQGEGRGRGRKRGREIGEEKGSEREKRGEIAGETEEGGVGGGEGGSEGEGEGGREEGEGGGLVGIRTRQSVLGLALNTAHLILAGSMRSPSRGSNSTIAAKTPANSTVGDSTVGVSTTRTVSNTGGYGGLREVLVPDYALSDCVHELLPLKGRRLPPGSYCIAVVENNTSNRG